MKILLLLFLLTTPLIAQTKTEKLTDDEINLLGRIFAIEIEAGACTSAKPNCDVAAAQELATAYSQAAKLPRVIRFLTASAVFKYQQMDGRPKSAMQVSQLVDQQNAKLLPLLIVQNQRIIELLEQLAAK